MPAPTPSPLAQPRVVSVTRRDGRQCVVSTTRTDGEAWDALVALLTAHPEEQGFARRLTEGVRAQRSPSELQYGWAHVLLGEMEARIARRSALSVTPAVPTGPALAHLSETFERATHEFGGGSAMRRPRVDLRAADGSTVSLRWSAARSRIEVSDGIGGYRSRYYGSISASGVLDLNVAATPEVFALLGRIATEGLARVGAECGRRIGTCSFCRRRLSDARSTSVGYGPICAGRYRLPWGARDGHEVIRAVASILGDAPRAASQPRVATAPITARRAVRATCDLCEEPFRTNSGAARCDACTI